MPQIRCEGNRLFGIVNDEAHGIYEAVCKSQFCKLPGYPSHTVLHRWNLEKITENGTILPIDTKRFK